MGELDRNFITMHTSSGDELNIIGDRCIAELKYCSVESFSYVRVDGVLPPRRVRLQ